MGRVGLPQFDAQRHGLKGPIINRRRLFLRLGAVDATRLAQAPLQVRVLAPVPEAERELREEALERRRDALGVGCRALLDGGEELAPGCEVAGVGLDLLA